MLNKDQWCNILEFSRQVKPDLSNYEEDGACKCASVLLTAAADSLMLMVSGYNICDSLSPYGCFQSRSTFYLVYFFHEQSVLVRIRKHLKVALIE